MRAILFLSFFFLFLNCEDKQSQKKSNPVYIEKAPKENIETPKTKSKKTKEPEFPVLDTKNAMEFFLQYEKEHRENKVRMTTDFGDIEILLFNETKFHRANFIYLTKRKYFNNTQFYRVIDNFMVQAGNSDDKKTARKRRKIGKYLLPKDTNRGFKHDRGVISMPSSEIDNPHKLASPYEFFIVQQTPGAYFLDGDYTIFGRVTKGMEVIDKIAGVKTDEADWPLRNIYIRNVEIIE
ncbi:peptidylprolyl isomerase [Hyunsoonleella sp. SJ7]|uniref:Peptidyl-prolyl cis-trans isomerase n=1 Tax=Hyunsoonleella aquatilis TaxID=2762758 RepID=A0A923H9P8_9FLAO|nr:peptidylprolyl isomerase [Hyunsoonleella aquatilis]MBC3757617.1 peptidylprolyl isomerase [Hyunsoonleella aquatilis]